MKGSRYFASKDVKGTADQNEKEDRTTESETSKFEKRQKNKKNSKAQPEVVHNLSDIDFTTARFPRKRLKKPQSTLKKEGKDGRPWRHSKTQRKSLREVCVTKNITTNCFKILRLRLSSTCAVFCKVQE